MLMSFMCDETNLESLDTPEDRSQAPCHWATCPINEFEARQLVSIRIFGLEKIYCESNFTNDSIPLKQLVRGGGAIRSRY